jgi:hypothetical protein
LLTNRESNIKQHSKINNILTNITIHGLGIGFRKPNQTHKQLYWKQINSGNYQLRHQVGGSKGTMQKYSSSDGKIHLQIHFYTIWLSAYFGK